MKSVRDIAEDRRGGYYSHPRREMLGFIPASARTILEVGCGAGDFGAALKRERRGEVWGIELSLEAAHEAVGKLDRVMAGNLETEEMHLPAGYFDCIVCNDVLEHLVDPWRVLRRLRSALKQGGTIVASIPNVRFYPTMRDLLLQRRWDYRDQGVLDRTHLRFFTAATIRELFESTGYRVETIRGINPCDFSWKFRLLNRVLLGRLDDMRYEQFACVVHP